jgi:hypothetical protein
MAADKGHTSGVGSFAYWGPVGTISEVTENVFIFAHLPLNQPIS